MTNLLDLSQKQLIILYCSLICSIKSHVIAEYMTISDSLVRMTVKRYKVIFNEELLSILNDRSFYYSKIAIRYIEDIREYNFDKYDKSKMSQNVTTHTDDQIENNEAQNVTVISEISPAKNLIEESQKVTNTRCDEKISLQDIINCKKANYRSFCQEHESEMQTLLNLKSLNEYSRIIKKAKELLKNK